MRVKLELSDWIKGYLAGLIDGEGSIGLYYCGHRWSPIVTVEMIDKIVPETMYELTCVGSFTSRPHVTGKTTLHRWSTQSLMDVYRLLETVKPYLLLKRAQADLLIHFCELTLTKRFNEGEGQRIHDAICALNHNNGRSKL